VKYLICCGEIIRWTALRHVAEQQDDFLEPKRLVHGTCPTCNRSFSYTGREIVGFEAEGYYACLACYSYKPEDFSHHEPVFANRRNWTNLRCDICEETLFAGLERHYLP